MATFIFFPEGAYGPTNNCVGIGDVLVRRGHRVVFVVEESFAGTLEAKGFEERLMRLGPKPEVEEAPGQFWKDFIRETAPVFRKPTIEQLEDFIAPTWQALLDGARYVDERLVEIFDEVQPDVICEDNVPCFPAIPASGRPWVRILSCNPLEVKDPDLPPTFSGYPSADRERLGRVPRRVPPHARRDARVVRRVRPGARRAAAARPASSSTSRRGSTSTSTPRRPTTRARSRSRRRGTAWSRACAAPTRAFELPDAARPPARRPRLPQPRLAWARRTST